MKNKIRQAYIKRMIDLPMFVVVNGFVAWYMYEFFERLFC